MDLQLAQKHVLITGGSKGIGLACAEAFLQAVEKGVPAIPVDEIFEVARVTIEVAELLRKQ